MRAAGQEPPWCHPAGAPAQPARVSGSASLPRWPPSRHAARSRLARSARSCGMTRGEPPRRREVLARGPFRGGPARPGTHQAPEKGGQRARSRHGVIPQERRRSRRECRDRRPYRDGRHPGTQPDPDTRSLRSLLRDDARGSIGAGASVGIGVPIAMATIQLRSPIPTLARGARSCGMTREGASVPARVSGSASLPRWPPSSYAPRSRHSLAPLAPAG